MLHPLGLFVLAMPLVTLGLIWIVGRLLYRHGPRWSFLAAPLFVLGPAIADYAYSAAQFQNACKAAGPARVLETASADGFLLQSRNAAEFGAGHLREGFRWIERRKPSGGWERVMLQPDDSVRAESIETPTARFLLIESIDRSRSWTRFSRSVQERESGRMIAEASYVIYAGGWLSQLLAPFDRADCAAPSAPGLWGFAGYDRLPVLVLQQGGADNSPKP